MELHNNMCSKFVIYICIVIYIVFFFILVFNILYGHFEKIDTSAVAEVEVV